MLPATRPGIQSQVTDVSCEEPRADGTRDCTTVDDDADTAVLYVPKLGDTINGYTFKDYTLMRRPRFTGHLVGERGDHAMAA